MTSSATSGENKESRGEGNELFHGRFGTERTTMESEEQNIGRGAGAVQGPGNDRLLSTQPPQCSKSSPLP